MRFQIKVLFFSLCGFTILLQFRLKDKISSFITDAKINKPPLMYGADKAAESLQKLPQWLQEYVVWSTEQRRLAESDPNHPVQYLITHCLKENPCGGLSDRFRVLPFLVLLAKATDRILIIKWTKPYDLTEFLIPPDGGLDWRSTPELDLLEEQHLLYFNSTVNYGCNPEITNRFPDQGQAFEPCVKAIKDSDSKYYSVTTHRDGNSIEGLNAIFMNYGLSKKIYKYYENGYTFPDLYGDLFRVLFEPTPPIASMVEKRMDQLRLIENQFISVHVRARYPTKYLLALEKTYGRFDKRGGLTFNDDYRLRDHCMNVSKVALDCALSISRDYPILFLSDSNETSAYLLKHYSEIVENSPKLVSIIRDEPLQLENTDFGPFDAPKISEYFSVFEDILIMGYSRCVIYGTGSYGSHGAGMISNKCWARYQDRHGTFEKCNGNKRIDWVTDTVNQS